VAIGRAFHAAGADLLDVSAGQVSRLARPIYGRMFQTPFADRVRNEAGVAAIAVGAIGDADQVNGIIAAGRADLCAVGRPHLANAAWTLTEAARFGWQAPAWPRPYRPGRAQLERSFRLSAPPA
jgi:anthraniloyl-CoA monooxygenase